MKLDPPANPNYAATVVTIRSLIPLDNCDNVVAAPLLGYQAIVGKDTKVGDVGIVFTAETQLSEEFARKNNLHRHSHLNDDESAKGYLEDNRRVRALKFRGHRSDALFMPLSSLAYTGWPEAQPGFDGVLSDGIQFDVIGDHEICRKYVRKTNGNIPSAKVEKITRVDEKFLPEHIDTENYFKNLYKLDENDTVIITQKLHGTSIRIGHTLVKRKLSLWERIARKFGAKIQEFEYDYVYGSRKVIKDPNNPNQNHFYGSDLWTEEGEKLKGGLPKGYIVYGEIIGWVGNSPIQKGYTYNLPVGARELYVYRVAHINPDGHVVDLSWEQVKEFCRNLGLKHVPEILTSWHDLADVGVLMDRRFADWRNDVVPTTEGVVDEGVCIRRDGLKPLILKAKSPKFLEHESKMIDQEVEDIEEQSTV